jgi:hypothetical protein
MCTTQNAPVSLLGPPGVEGRKGSSESHEIDFRKKVGQELEQ